jgi:hypothetical protein
MVMWAGDCSPNECERLLADGWCPPRRRNTVATAFAGENYRWVAVGFLQMIENSTEISINLLTHLPTTYQCSASSHHRHRQTIFAPQSVTVWLTFASHVRRSVRASAAVVVEPPGSPTAVPKWSTTTPPYTFGPVCSFGSGSLVRHWHARVSIAQTAGRPSPVFRPALHCANNNNSRHCKLQNLIVSLKNLNNYILYSYFWQRRWWLCQADDANSLRNLWLAPYAVSKPLNFSVFSCTLETMTTSS